MDENNDWRRNDKDTHNSIIITSILSNFAYTFERHHAHFVSQAPFLSPRKDTWTFPACLRLIRFMLNMQRTAV